MLDQAEMAAGPDVVLAGQTAALPSHGAGQEIDLSTLYKPKKSREAKPPSFAWLQIEKLSFADFAKDILTEEVRARIIQARARAATTGLPLLRVALGWNTKDRIKCVAYHLFGLKLPKSYTRPKLISELVARLTESVGTFPAEIASVVADLGIAHCDDDCIVKGEIVLLRANGLSNAGENCVVACENLSGWVIRGSALFAVDFISINKIYWARLVEQRKNLLLM